MVAALVAGALFTRQLLWSPISAINMLDVTSNQFKMLDAKFQGTDSNGQPFKLIAASGRQEYEHPDIVFLERVSGHTTQIQNGRPIVRNFSARAGEYNRTNKTVTLRGNVHIKSSDGNEIQTNELVIRI